ncbi:efflux RND transporter periplasmic adaptor subunit [Undibacterium sp. TJN25]|uniref:efflux RND transporter periplasmic adaptor subunit n=1 Tax=Undibacterium sp. TJN25 TaxID=3413056 RepID=UPI003BF1B3A0
MMKFLHIDKKQGIAIAVMVAAGVLLAALILASGKDKTAAGKGADAAASHGEQENYGDEHKAESKDGEKISFSDQQIIEAGMAIAVSGPVRMERTVQLSGEIILDEDRTAHVVPRLAGVVDSVPGKLGQQVKKGQLLAVIASTQLADMRSELLAAQKRRALAQLTYEREKKLWQEKISAEQDFLQAQQSLAEAGIATQNAQQKLAALGALVNGSGRLSLYELRAPFDGLIVEKHITLGESVKEDAIVFTIADLSTVWAEVIVAAKDLEIVRVGSKAAVRTASTDTVANGRVSYVGSLLGEQTRTAKARIALDNPGMAWRPGLLVNVDLSAGDREVPVAVLAEALQTLDGKPVVFVKADGGFVAQQVQTGDGDGKYLEVRKGLKAGVSYAAGGSFVIKAEQGKDSAGHAH